MRLLLHACCGPCLLEPLDALAAEADEVAIIYANPNIHPAEEYVRRRDTLLEHANALGLTVVEEPYDPDRWHELVAPLADRGKERCRACFRLRFAMAARYAAEHGYDALATTLTVSPYQDPEIVREEGMRAAETVGVAWLDRDFRDRYPEATRRSRELGMYRQNYCGCEFSAAEAQAERDARRAQRAAAKQAARSGEAE